MYAIDLFENPGTPEADPRPQPEYVPSGPHVPGSRNRALGNANLALIMKSLDTPGNPPITLSFLNGTARQINGDEINDIADYYDALKTKTEKANFIYRTLVSQEKMSNLIAQLKQTALDFSQPQQPEVSEPEQLDLFKEEKKSSDNTELTGHTAKDVTVARELQKLRARHPAAKSDIEALIKDEIVNAEKNKAEDESQNEKINQLEQTTDDLQDMVKNMRAANSRLQSTLDMMRQRPEKPQVGVSVATDKIPAKEPEKAKVSVPAKEPKISAPPLEVPAPTPTVGKEKAKAAQLPAPEKKATQVQIPALPGKEKERSYRQLPRPTAKPISVTTIGGQPATVLPKIQKAGIPGALGGGFRRGHPVARVMQENNEQTLQDVLFRTAAKAMYDASQHGVDMDYETAIRTASKLMKIPYAPSMLPALNDQLAAVDKKIKTLKSVRKAQRAREQEKLTHQTDPEEQKRTQAYWKERGKQMASRLKMREEGIDRSGGKMYKAQEAYMIVHNGKEVAFYKPNEMKQAYADAQGLAKKLGGEVHVKKVMREANQPKDQDVLGQLFKDFEKIFGKQPQQPQQPQKPVKEAMRAGYNPLTSQEHWHEVKNHLTKLLSNEAIPYEDKQVIRQRYLEKKKEAEQKGWEK